MPIRIFKTKISVFHTLLICVLLSVTIYLVVEKRFEDKITNDGPQNLTSDTRLNIVRDMKHYRFAKPLRYFDMNNESEGLLSIKSEIKKIVAEQSESGNIINASIYLRNMETGEWVCVNPDQGYHPGSLFKVPVLMYYLKESEKDPSVLDKKLMIGDQYTPLPLQTFPGQAIEKNRPYTVRELLKYMISYSDNNATFLLNNNLDIPKLQNMFKDFNLNVPDVHDNKYTISIRDYSIFLRTLYNATYLNAQNSDYALDLLAQSTFKKGLADKIPQDVPIARKFGEMYDGQFKELHECGIIYCNKTPYMLTVMTKGYNATQMASVISAISDSIYHYFCS